MDPVVDDADQITDWESVRAKIYKSAMKEKVCLLLSHLRTFCAAKTETRALLPRSLLPADGEDGLPAHNAREQ